MNTKKVAESLKAGHTKNDKKVSSLQMLSNAFKNLNSKKV